MQKISPSGISQLFESVIQDRFHCVNFHSARATLGMSQNGACHLHELRSGKAGKGLKIRRDKNHLERGRECQEDGSVPSTQKPFFLRFAHLFCLCQTQCIPKTRYIGGITLAQYTSFYKLQTNSSNRIFP
ncbi:hypothetical protein TNCV_4101821 [Trichonephila clavipes]|nr:hypothetical protein TNCV_4101821 [Trichonephila clavipes]